MKTIKLLGMAIIAIAFVTASCSKHAATTAEPTQNEVAASVNQLSTPDELFLQELSLLDCYDPTVVDLTAPCTRELDPVCACGVATFANPCEAERFGFKNYTSGACLTASCKSPLLEALLAGTNCAEVYQPVCGCDGKTYGNACAALVSGVAVYTPGECGGLGVLN